MYNLYKLNRILSINKCGNDNVHITHSAFIEGKSRSILVIVCSNGCLLFRTTSITNDKPIIHQFQWFYHAEKEIKAIQFDRCGNWLLVAVKDGTLYLVPTIRVQGQSPKGPYNWRNDDVTEIRLSGQRANPTSLRWWHSFDGQQIAIIGNELGEISFVNLKTRKEVGGTYVSVGIQNLDLVQDEHNNTTCLLITGTTKQQWHLLLEDKQNAFFWLAEPETEQGLEGIERKMWQLHGDRSLFIEDKKFEGQPRRLSRYEGGAILFPQVIRGQNYVAAYTKASGVLQLLSSKLESLSIPCYHVPFDCEQLVMVERVFFLVRVPEETEDENPETEWLILNIVACQSVENVKKPKETPDPLLQEFRIGSDLVNIHRLQNTNTEEVEASDQTNTENPQKEKIPLPPEVFLDGCILVHKNYVIECKFSTSPTEQFLKLTSLPSDLPAAERLGVLLGLDIHKLYEAGAEMQLASGHFAQAVRLYQLSKSPQLKRVAHFVSYGYLSELIAYIQVLFSTKGMEIATLDKAHFANIALHCFVQQVLERRHERPAVLQAFKDFLRDNQYYDDEVAIRLLEEQGLYELLYYCTKLRGQQRLMIEHLLACDNLQDSVDKETYDSLISNGFQKILSKKENEKYLQCVTCPGLLQHLASNPQLLRCHLQHIAQLLPNISVQFLLNVAQLYDPCHPAAGLAVRSVVTSHSQRYFSMSSLSSISSDSLELAHSDEDNVREEDLIKFYIFVLLVLNHKRGPHPRPFDLKVMEMENKLQAVVIKAQTIVTRKNDNPIACGFSHALLLRQGVMFSWGKGQHGRLGQGEPFQETSMPTAVDLTDTRIISLSCGFHHTMALTDYGIFAWGSSRYGQLGLGDLQRTCRPLLIESLMEEDIVSVVCGQYHTLALSTMGCVFTWGWGVHGQLGHSSPEDCRVPVQIDFFKNMPIVSICAGHGHSAVLTKQGEVYTFGCGMFGQLGQGTSVKHSTPRLVELPEPVFILTSGYFHMLALTQTQSQKLHIWGSHPQSLRMQAQSSRRARLQQQQPLVPPIPESIGNGSSSVTPPSFGTPHFPSCTAIMAQSQMSQAHLSPSLVNLPLNCGKIIKMSAGSNHSALLTIDGEVFTWGRNNEGQLGQGSRKEQKQPVMVLSLNDRHITEIGCGSDFTLVLDGTNRLWGWGQNDCGQLGQKPSSNHESRSRASSILSSASIPPGSMTGTSNSGRVITIRTNRRMITITQSCRQGEMRPIEIVTLPPMTNNVASGGLSNATITADFDLTSFENEFLLQKVSYKQRRRENPSIPNLGSREDHLYGPRSLHTALKVFHKFYDPTSILNHCLSFSDLQGAAKLCILEGLYAQAIDYQFQALNASLSNRPANAIELETIAIEIIHYYVKFIDQNNCEANRQFLEHAAAFWVKHSLPAERLETFLSNHLNMLGYPLGLLLFCNHSSKKGVAEQLLPRLSPNFCIDVSASILKCIDAGNQHPELLDHLVSATGSANLLRQLHTATSDGLAGWEASLPTQALWQEVLHNFQKGALSRCSLHLSSSSVELLTKALISERAGGGAIASILGDDIVAFTCGHHFTLHTFKSSVLPGFQEALHRLPCPLPQTERLLMQGYQMEGLLPTACPPCVLTEIKSELL